MSGSGHQPDDRRTVAAAAGHGHRDRIDAHLAHVASGRLAPATADPGVGPPA
ncbi:hypothetical protein AB0469_36325 [Streptomyces sp. NPDC093801]|uniref:hypothetical protein n=1 Tax=Streptomyces sp. NPDC093801 TaxID=3155203 RepID=UPI00344EF5A0